MHVDLIGITQPIGISVLLAVNGSIPIRVLNQRVCVQNIHFNPVREIILVGVSRCRIGFVCVDFLTVTQAVLIHIRNDGVGLMDVELARIIQAVQVGVLVSIMDAVFIGVFSQRTRAEQIHFDPIIKFIPIRISFGGVGGMCVDFIPITQAVLIRVRHVWIGVMDVEFVCIVQAV